jgi:hypothetical protein
MINCEEYPRVLIVGYDVVNATGTGVTMSCLFKEWPKHRIAIASSNMNIGESDFAGEYYRFGTLENRWVWPLSIIPRESWKVSGPVSPINRFEQMRAFSPDGFCSEEEPSLKTVTSSLLRRVWYKTLDIIGANDLTPGLHMSSQFASWVSAFKPDIIYSLLGSFSLVHFVGRFLDEIDVPLVLHFMD